MKKNIFSFMAISMLCMFNANAIETSCFWKSKTPWQKMLTVLDKHGVDTTGMNVASIVSCDVLHEAADDLAKVFGVKEEMSWTTYYTKDIMVGDAICEYMKVKYARRNGEKYEYYKIMYSTDEDDFVRFASLYPNSKYRRDCGDKEWCLRAYWEWILNCRTEANCSTAFEYSRHGDECRQEGYVTMAYAVMDYMDTYDDWQSLMAARAKNGYDDCEAFVRFKEEHEGYLSAYAYSIRDSVSQCRHRNAWKAATETNTIASYRDYLAAYPYGEYAYWVKKKIRDYEDWMEARDRDNYAAYQEYCENHPYGDSIKVANDAKKRIEDADWQRIKDTKNWMDISDYIKKYPNGYYTIQADEKMHALWGSAAINMNTLFNIVGFSAAKDSGIVFLSNIDKRGFELTFNLYFKGSSGKKLVKSKTLQPGEYCYFRIKNGIYEVEISSLPKNFHHKTIPTYGYMDIENYVYDLSYCMYDTKDSTLSTDKLMKKYSDPVATKRSQGAVSKVVAMEELKLLETSLGKEINVSNGICTIFLNGYVDLQKIPTVVITGKLLKESKEAFYGFVENNTDRIEVIKRVGKAGFGLRVVSVNSISGKAEIVEFTTKDVMSFANKLEKMGMK